MKVYEQVTAALRHYGVQTMIGLIGEETCTSQRRANSLGGALPRGTHEASLW
jgi:hypothetical protein